MKAARWHTCNILQSGVNARRLWRFVRSGRKVELAGQEEFLVDDPLPRKSVARTVRHLWQPRLNVAWLPSEQVFLRVIQLPPGDPKELPGMIELQLEGLSPLPLAQVVWTLESLPSDGRQTQTVIVVLAARAAVEPFLGDLEGAGFLADRLELPLLRLLLENRDRREGVWIYARREPGGIKCLLAWWNQGELINLNLLSLPGDETAGTHLAALLRQFAWAAEMEGWLTPEASWHLVADVDLTRLLEPILREFAGGQVEVREAASDAELAAVSARAADAGNLIPSELATRYRQKFVDGLWMWALMGLVALYMLYLGWYFGNVAFLNYREARLGRQVAALRGDYTKAQQLKSKIQVFQEQINLKYAALDCLKAASETLPEEMVMDSFSFQRGQQLLLVGTVPMEAQDKVLEYAQALDEIVVQDQPLFESVGTPSITAPGRRGGSQPARWSITCDIRRDEPR